MWRRGEPGYDHGSARAAAGVGSGGAGCERDRPSESAVRVCCPRNGSGERERGPRTEKRERGVGSPGRRLLGGRARAVAHYTRPPYGTKHDMYKIVRPVAGRTLSRTRSLPARPGAGHAARAGRAGGPRPTRAWQATGTGLGGVREGQDRRGRSSSCWPSPSSGGRFSGWLSSLRGPLSHLRGKAPLARAAACGGPRGATRRRSNAGVEAECLGSVSLTGRACSPAA